MPIGKNSLKRVSNNGYSAVKSTAPDMENSVVVAPEEKPAEKKPAAKKTAPVSPKTPTAAKKTAAKKPASGTVKKSATAATKKTATKPVAKAAPVASAPTAPARKRGRPPKKAVNAIPTATETAAKVTGAKEGFKGYYNIGDDMPVYLL